MNKSSYLAVSFTLALALFAGRSASAQIFVFTDQTSYDVSSYSVANITFDGSTPSQSSYAYDGDPASLTVGGVAFTTPAGTDLYVVGPAYNGGSNEPEGDTSAFVQVSGDTQTDAPISLFATLPSSVGVGGVTAIGTQIGTSYAYGPITATVTLMNGSTATYIDNSSDALDDGLGFLGFVSTGSPIESVSFTDSTLDSSGTVNISLDNFTYGAINVAGNTGTPVTVTPEPTSLSLLLAGAVGALLFFRRRLAVS